MKTLIVGCRTLENELSRAIAECGCPHEVRWVESGLHNVPKNLASALQMIIDSAQDYSCALMAFGFCGNAISGLRSGGVRLIFPRVDDCISLLLGSFDNKQALSEAPVEDAKMPPEGRHGTYFMTEGWLKGERNIWKEYQHAIQKYGEELGGSIIEMMLEHYKTLALLDTGCFDLPGANAEMTTIAETLKLEYKVFPATIEYLKRLLTGPWDESSFLVIPPYSVIQESDLVLRPPLR